MLCMLLVFGQVACAADVSKSLVVVFGHEGGLQCDSNDPGNWSGGRVGVGRKGCTKYGIATNSYPNLNIKELSLKQAATIYTRDYWNPLRLTELESQGLATEIFDTAVNCGVGTSANILLSTINFLAPAPYKLNGKINAEQIEWINKYTRKKSNRVTFWKVLNVMQANRYMQIIHNNPKMLRYSNSWFGRVGG